MLFKSPFPSISVPELDLPTFIFRHAEENSIFGKNPELPALIDGEKAITYRELKELSVKFASGLVNNLGLKPGDVVAIVLPNTMYFPVVTLGTQMMGGVCMTTNPGYNASELEYQFKMTEPKAVITEAAISDTVAKALQQASLTNTLTRIITIDDDDNNKNTGNRTHWTLRSVFSTSPFERIYITTQERQSRDLAFIVFSSGTSGRPKGVMLSHRNMIANVVQCNEFDKHDKVISAADKRLANHKYMVVLPLYHIYALTLVLHAGLSKGGTMLIMRKYSLKEFCELSQRHKATIGHLVPPIFLNLAKDDLILNYDLSNYVFLNSGAAPLSRDLQAAVQARVNTSVIQAYGLSEASPVSHRALINETAMGSVGPLIPSMDSKIIDEDGKRLSVREVGEICLRGPNIMVGYLKDPQATKETIDNEGFLHTGDIGYADERGNFYISDRKKELIKFKGFQVAPAELEGILIEHPAVADCAVISVYDESRASEIPKAYVSVRPDHNVPGIGETIRAWMDSKVANHKKLRGGVEIIDQIPKSPSGKILRRHLRDREASRRAAKSLNAKL